MPAAWAGGWAAGSHLLPHWQRRRQGVPPPLLAACGSRRHPFVPGLAWGGEGSPWLLAYLYVHCLGW